MAANKSTGQKKQTRAMAIVVVSFVVMVFVAATLAKYVALGSLEWVADAAKATAVVIGVNEENEEYRDNRGRKRYRVWLAYQFDAEGQTITGKTDVSTVPKLSRTDQELVILYQPGNPQKHTFEYHVKSTLSKKGLLPYVISTLPFTGGAAYFLHIILALLWVRKSTVILPEGFYKEDRWLDVDDKYVVGIDQGDLVYFDIHKKRVKEVQQAFQEGKPMSELVQLGQYRSLVTMPLSDITKVVTDHNSDVIYVTHNGTEHRVEFLNVKVKAHALKRILRKIPHSKQYEKRERSRLNAVKMSLIGSLLVIGAAWYFDHSGSYVIAVFVLVAWLVPTFLSRLLDPHTTRTWLIKRDMNNFQRSLN